MSSPSRHPDPFSSTSYGPRPVAPVGRSHQWGNQQQPHAPPSPTLSSASTRPPPSQQSIHTQQQQTGPKLSGRIQLQAYGAPDRRMKKRDHSSSRQRHSHSRSRSRSPRQHRDTYEHEHHHGAVNDDDIHAQQQLDDVTTGDDGDELINSTYHKSFAKPALHLGLLRHVYHEAESKTNEHFDPNNSPYLDNTTTHISSSSSNGAPSHSNASILSFGSSSASTSMLAFEAGSGTGPGGAPSTNGVVGGLDADFENFEKSLGLRTGEDVVEFFARHANTTPVKFVYCNRKDTGDEFRPYDLIVVPRKKVNGEEYFTISTSGVVHIQGLEPSEFISLSQWMHESSMYNVLRSIRFFKHYLIAKTFRLWRSNVRYRLYCKQRKNLCKKLFLARDSFCAPLLEVNKIMYEMDQIQLTDVKIAHPLLAEKFVKDQVDARTAAGKKFEERMERLADTVEKVCKGVKDRARQYDHRIANDDLSNSRFAQHLLGGNGRIKSMVAIKKERADRLRQLKHANLEADMLGDFIRLIDYVEVEHLVTKAKESITSFFATLLQASASNKALFITFVSFGVRSGLLHYSPTVREIHTIVQAMHEGNVTTVDTVDRILHHPKFKPFVSPLLTDSPKVARIIHRDRLYHLTKNNIQEKIDHDFHSIENTIAFLEKHRPVYEFGLSWNLDTYMDTILNKMKDTSSNNAASVDVIQKDMFQQTEWSTGIRRIRDNYEVGIIQAETKTLKNKLFPITELALNGMKELLLKIFHTKCMELSELYTSKIKSLDEDPLTLPQYASYIEMFTRIKVEGKDMSDQAKKIEHMHRLMLDYDMQSMIPPQDEVAFDDLQSSVAAFDQQIIVSENRIEEKMSGMKQTVYKNIARLQNELEQQKNLLEEGVFIDDKAQPKDVVKALDGVKKQLDDIKAQTQTLQGYQVLLENEPYAFPTLATTFHAYDRKRVFWTLYADWMEKYKTWMNADFLTLDVENIDREVTEMYQTAFKINKEMRDSSVTNKVKNMISEFKSIMPMVLELGNKAIKPSHWKSIFSALSQGYYPNDKIRLKKLKQMNIFHHKQLISDICEQAVGEYGLQQALSKVQKVWSTQDFVVQPYGKNREVSILSDVDDVMSKLEDTQATLQSMLGSPFIQAVQQEVEIWDKKLSFLAEILDEWLTCQRNYCYLEPLFSSADLQRQLPSESKMFQEVDRFWKEVMRRLTSNLNNTPSSLNVMLAISAPNLLPSFEKANKELDRILHHLNEYLETKRSVFPRFYFLSNDELLAILSQSKNVQNIQPHCIKLFDSIASLKFKDDVENSIDIIGMTSPEGEYVPFPRTVYARGNTETWLLEVEDMMRYTVKSLTQKALLSYPQEGPEAIDRKQWLTNNFAQPILTVDQIMWTAAVTSALRAIEGTGTGDITTAPAGAAAGAGADLYPLKKFFEHSKSQISAMVDLVRGNLTKLQRMMMSSLIILDVHGRDVLEKMLEKQCSSLQDFEWQKQLRYYWENTLPVELRAEAEKEYVASKSTEVPEYEDCLLRQTNGTFTYRLEYLGLATRLVITPLTDRAYLTLTGALHLHYGGAPAGPAGTGKTETVKDLAKAMAVQCVVFNCSDGLKAKMMAQYFSGLSQCGAWACFDEFNRIDIEVLSVIAQQILTIQSAIISHKSQFEFEGRIIPLDLNFGVFITMNPGYAGRTELPDNLKALFRPVAMMVPDYALIAQIILFSEGFQTATILSKKMVKLFSLASEQLSQQSHYDFGMRAVKSILVMAGGLKRANPELAEDVLLIRSMMQSNIPKFLSHDIPLFRGIVRDLFPTSVVPESDYGVLQQSIEAVLSHNKLQPVPAFITKILQLYETMTVRHGVMLVGDSMTGKTTCSDVLAAALGKIASEQAEAAGEAAQAAAGDHHPFFREVVQYRLNPKSIPSTHLFGHASKSTGEWQDGLVAWLFRRGVEETHSHSEGAASTITVPGASKDGADPHPNAPPCRKWLIFDGLVDAVWIENMNTVLDDNKMLCLNNGERIKMSPAMTMVFEVGDLAVASPATVSRCGMVYLEPEHVGVLALVDSWKDCLIELVPEKADWVETTLKNQLHNVLTFIKEECTQLIPSNDSNLVRGCLNLIEALIKAAKEKQEADGGVDDSEMSTLTQISLFTAFVWSFGANIHEKHRLPFSKFLRNLFLPIVSDLPATREVYDWVYDQTHMQWVQWDDKIIPFQYDPMVPYFNILVSTAETVKYTYILETLLAAEKNVLFIGETGVGKSVIVNDWLRSKSSPAAAGAAAASSAAASSSGTAAGAQHGKAPPVSYIPIAVMFSAQTSSLNLQDIFESKLEKKRKTLLGAPVGKKMVIFVDDMNLPQREFYGACPPLELLRQTIDQGGFYNRGKLFFKRVQDVLYVGACAPPGGGRNVMTQRLTRHFHHVWLPQLSDASLKHIFSSILAGFLTLNAAHWSSENGQPVEVAHKVVDSAVDVYNAVRLQLLPTPSKSHYTFNLRDLSKLVQGVLQISRNYLPDLNSLLRLFLHESARVFRDRLSDDIDRLFFNELLSKTIEKHFAISYKMEEFQDLIFGDLPDGSTPPPLPPVAAADGSSAAPAAAAAGAGGDDRDYHELTYLGLDKLNDILSDQLKEYNLMFSNQMHLVFFRDAILHLTRIQRVLRQPRGNALLIGLGGSGRQSLTRLAAFICGYKCMSIEISKNFGTEQWKETIKKILEVAGCENKPIVFLLADSHIVDENFLEDVNNLLNAGEVPNLYEPEEIEQIVARVRPLLKQTGKQETRDNILAHFVHLVRENLHIVLCFSPVGDVFRSRCRRYPSLVNCCTIDVFSEWGRDALAAVADRFLSDRSLGLENMRTELGQVCVKIHASVSLITPRYYQELRRHNYVTPTSYLELLKLYSSMLVEQRDSVSKKIMKYRNGLNKLQQTNKMVEDLKIDLIKLQPVLKTSSEEVAALLIDLERDQKEANETAAICQRDAEQCAETTRQVQIIADECKQDLDEAMPAYEAAVKQLDTLKKEHITVLKSFTSPPKAVVKVMEAVCILFGVNATWDEAKRLLNNMKFLEMCKEYDKDHIGKPVLKKLQKYLTDPEFVPEALQSVSVVAVSLCAWVRAMDVYARVMKAVAPKKAALEAAEASLREAQETLAAKQLSLKVVEARVAALQAKFRQKQNEKDELEQNIERTKVRLIRAEKLVSGLASEEKRWLDSSDNLAASLKNLVGNIILSAGCVAYLGPFTSAYRQELLAEWVRFCTLLHIPVDEHFSLVQTLADPLVVRKWQIMGLPADNYSTENGVLVTKGRRWPLMIDPQGQANRWIRNMGKKENLHVIKQTDNNYIKVLENAIRYGQPVLLTDVEERLEGALDPLLQKNIFRKGGQWLLRLADQDVPFSPEFRFYITTKLPNPHILPETFVKISVINFTVTLQGLEDQLLVVLCSTERNDLETKNDRLIVQISDDKNELDSIEQKILDMLSNAQGNILDNQELIETLGVSKVTSLNVTQRMIEAEQIVKNIKQVRESYRVVATRGSILYFTIADLSRVDPMYQYSLQFFLQLYSQRIKDTEKREDLQERLDILLNDLVSAVYVNICRGLFEKDKLLFSLLLAVQIAKGAALISEAEYAAFIRDIDTNEASEVVAAAAAAASASGSTEHVNPCPDWLKEEVWQALYLTAHSAGAAAYYTGILADLRQPEKASEWRLWFNSFSAEYPAGIPLPHLWQSKLSPFQRLLLIKLLRRDKITFGVKEFVSNQLGPKFIKPPPFDLHSAFASSNNKTPLIFILSPGANPMPYLQKLAREKNIEESRFKSLSLGEGQGPIAEELMENGRRDGDWVVLQNCHLSVSFLPTLERTLEQASLAEGEVHEDFRLFLTSMPTAAFPVPILQNSIKITNEPPRGLSNNMMRTYLDISTEEYEGCLQTHAFKKLFFGLAFFHAVLQERRRYGPIGFVVENIDFMSSDLEVSKKQLRMYLDEQAQLLGLAPNSPTAAASIAVQSRLSTTQSVPWTTLTEIIGEVNYAGRVTDDRDQRCLRSILRRCFHPHILQDDYKLTDSGVYYAPSTTNSLNAVRDYIASLPDDTPDAFGLHENADITFQLQETNNLLNTLVNLQPRVVGGGGSGGKSSDDTVSDLILAIEARIPADLDKKTAHPSVFADLAGMNTLGVFLGQEIDRFNRLLQVIRTTLKDLSKAIRGIVVMSSELEKMYNGLLYNQVPSAWTAAAYPSLKSLSGWVDDLLQRVTFLRDWISAGEPRSYWISGFFFPQGFLTAVLQKYARMTKIPIDTLKFKTHLMKQSQTDLLKDPASVKVPEKGVYIYGLFLQGASFDRTASVLYDSPPGELFYSMPLIWLEPITLEQAAAQAVPASSIYECPVYKTSKRAGVLSTTGHSTNFVIFLQLPTRNDPDHWVRRGTAMLLQLD